MNVRDDISIFFPHERFAAQLWRYSADDIYSFHNPASARNYVKVHRTTLTIKIKISLSRLKLKRCIANARYRVIKHVIFTWEEAFEWTDVVIKQQKSEASRNISKLNKIMYMRCKLNVRYEFLN